MNQKTAKRLRREAGGDRQRYQALKREWATLTQKERARRRRAAEAAAAKEGAKPEAPKPAPQPPSEPGKAS